MESSLVPWGKQHGGLSRAGKVKSHTPKVEKKVKRKARLGREKKRVQYNKRYVNAGSAAGGKKKGPNAQNVSNVAAPPEKKE
jgi:small subunit ribosomal protein S30e